MKSVILSWALASALNAGTVPDVVGTEGLKTEAQDVSAPALADDVAPGYNLLAYEFEPYTRSQVLGNASFNANGLVQGSRSIWDHRQDRIWLGALNLTLGRSSAKDRVSLADEMHRGTNLGVQIAWSSDAELRRQALAQRIELEGQRDRARLELNWQPSGAWTWYSGNGPNARLSLGLGSSFGLQNQSLDSQTRTYDSNGGLANQSQSSQANLDLDLRLIPQGALGLGWGRIIATEAAWRALHLARALARAGRLKRALERDEAQALARELLEIQQAFDWDPREQRIDEARRLHAFMADRGLIDGGDAEALLRIADAHEYPQDARGRGWSIDLSGRYQSSLFYVYRNDSSGYNGASLSLFHDPVMRLDLKGIWERPWSLDWQGSLQVGLGMRNDLTEHFGSISEYQTGLWDAGFSLGLGYYPDTRFAILLSNASSLQAQNQRIVWSGNSFVASSYAERNFNNSTFLTLRYQAAFNTTLSLNSSLVWTRQQFFNEVYRGNVAGAASAAFDSEVAGWPVQEIVNLSSVLVLTYRIR